MKKYIVDYNINGCIEVEADSIENAMKVVGNITEDKILEDSLTWGMNIETDEVKEEEELLKSIRELDKIRKIK